MILFSNSPDADLGYLHAAIADGRLSWERVDDAIARQLGLKAALGLHRTAAPSSDVPREANRAYAEQVALKVPTLVKDVQNLLPLDPAKHRRVLVVSGGIVFPFLPDPCPSPCPTCSGSTASR